MVGRAAATPRVRGTGRRWAGGAAVAWCALFGALHLYWGLGGEVGFARFSAPNNRDLVAAGDAGYLRFTLLVGVVLALAAAAVLVCLRPWGQRLPRWLVLTGLWAACALCLVRGVGNPVQDLLLLSGAIDFAPFDGPWPQAREWYEWLLLDAVAFSPYFVLGAALFGLTARSLPRGDAPVARAAA